VNLGGHVTVNPWRQGRDNVDTGCMFLDAFPSTPFPPYDQDTVCRAFESSKVSPEPKESKYIDPEGEYVLTRDRLEAMLSICDLYCFPISAACLGEEIANATVVSGDNAVSVIGKIITTPAPTTHNPFCNSVLFNTLENLTTMQCPQ
jgi:hypothetical protein